MVESQTPLATQCLEFCQTLTSKGHAFTFNLTLGSSFSFSLDTKMKVTSLETKKKKKSPSTREETWRGKKTTWKGKKLRKRIIQLTWNPPARLIRLLSAASALCRFLCRRLSIGKFKLQVSFSLGSFVSDKNIWNALSISLLYLGASWLQAHKPANLQKNQ